MRNSSFSRLRAFGSAPAKSAKSPSRMIRSIQFLTLMMLTAGVSLAQTVRVSATGYDIDQLIVEQGRLDAQRQELVSDLNRLGREPAIRKQAIDVGLAPLVAPLVVTPR